MAQTKTTKKSETAPSKSAAKAPAKAAPKAAPKNASPLAAMKAAFGTKDKLVEAVTAFTTEDLWVGRTSKDRGGDKTLKHVSNAKLLRLHQVFTQVKSQFGTRDKLIGAILDLEKRAKDEGYKGRLSAFPVPRLYDLYKAAAKRAKAASK